MTEVLDLRMVIGLQALFLTVLLSSAFAALLLWWHYKITRLLDMYTQNMVEVKRGGVGVGVRRNTFYSKIMKEMHRGEDERMGHSRRGKVECKGKVESKVEGKPVRTPAPDRKGIKGMPVGSHHNGWTKRKIGKASKNVWASYTPEQYKARQLKMQQGKALKKQQRLLQEAKRIGEHVTKQYSEMGVDKSGVEGKTTKLLNSSYRNKEGDYGQSNIVSGPTVFHVE